MADFCFFFCFSGSPRQSTHEMDSHSLSLRQVHKVHKYTYFEKLLANVEATFTFVQASRKGMMGSKVKTCGTPGRPGEYRAKALKSHGGVQGEVLFAS